MKIMHFFDLKLVSGNELKPYAKSIAALKAEVLEGYPYLHDTSPQQETALLENVPKDTLFILATEQKSGQLVGVTTVLSFKDTNPLYSQSINLDCPQDEAYLIEDVLVLPKWRSHGVGRQMYHMAENHLRMHAKAQFLTFVTVNRPKINPLNDTLYFFPESYMLKKGFIKRGDLNLVRSWKDKGTSEETSKTHTIWVKPMPQKVVAFPQNQTIIQAPFKRVSRL